MTRTRGTCFCCSLCLRCRVFCQNQRRVCCSVWDTSSPVATNIWRRGPCQCLWATLHLEQLSLEENPSNCTFRFKTPKCTHHKRKSINPSSQASKSVLIHFSCESSKTKETVSTRMITSASPPLRSRSSSLASHASTSKAKRKSTSLPSTTVEYLKNWMMSPAHIAHPYPTEQEKAQIMKDTGIELKQSTNWFVNNRKRYWKPRVEARLQEQAKASSGPETTSTSKAASIESSSTSSGAHATSPSRRHSLVHIISTPNVSALVEQAAVEEQQRASPVDTEAAPVTPSLEAKSVSYHQQVPSEVSCTLSENDESVGMNLDTDEMSTGQPTHEEQPSVCKELVDVHVLAPSTSSAPTIHDVIVGQLPLGSKALHTFAKCDLIYTVFSSRKVRHNDTTRVRRNHGFRLTLSLFGCSC